MPRYAVLSDVHGNLAALQQVLSDIGKRAVTGIWYLGDLVVYGPNPRECLALLYRALEATARCAELGALDEAGVNQLVAELDAQTPAAWPAPAIKGNNDYVIARNDLGGHVVDDWIVQAGLTGASVGGTEQGEIMRRERVAATQISHEWTRRVLTKAERGLLAALAEKPALPDDGVMLVHASPCELIGKEGDYIRTLADAEEAFLAMNESYPQVQTCFFGHTHHALVFEQTTATRPYDNCREHVFGGTRISSGTAEFSLNENRLLVNPGSVGQPRDGDARAAYCVLDTNQRKIEFHRLPYDLERTLRDLRRAAPQFATYVSQFNATGSENAGNVTVGQVVQVMEKRLEEGR